ncbi:ATPase H(+)-transporting accessory protein 2 isoform X2 [Coccinella septempunctata]|uniref:ATPase H(+)-transporting accessory protein 2 isoform X2 n=1 Tax=Coccinella septempunctata TaxID=41139 RepID=UPI001D072DAD|nr:ATPase H(+)-transporting accessory protein 2 isoform X2 [Coccinella septempunctata]
MLIHSVFVAALLIGAHSDGEFSILNYPKSVSFKGHDHLKESNLKEVYFATLGFSNSQFSNWKGLYINDPFNLAEGIATVVVEGMPSIDQPKGHHFPLKTDTEDDSIFSTLKDGINLRYPDTATQIVHVDLANNLEDSDNNLFKDIKIEKPNKNTYLKNEAENREFLKDIDLLNAIAEKVHSNIKSDGIPDLFWFKLSSLHPVVDLYGENSTEVKEAKHLLNEAVLRLNEAFRKAYNGAVLFSVITSDASHTRKTRSILATGKDRQLNLASEYSEDFPVIFNIVLWLCVVLGFSLLAISLVIGNMDPGRDSIIYRMTNPRMKKDN